MVFDYLNEFVASKKDRRTFIIALLGGITLFLVELIKTAIEWVFFICKREYLFIEGDKGMWITILSIIIGIFVLLFIINSALRIDSKKKRVIKKKVNKTFILVLALIFFGISYYILLINPINKFSEINSWVGNTTTMCSADLNFSSESSSLNENFIILGKKLHLVGAANCYSGDTENQNVTLYLVVSQINKISLNESLCGIRDGNSENLGGSSQKISSNGFLLPVSIDENLTLPEGGWEISICAIRHKDNDTNDSTLILTNHVEVISVKNEADIYYSYQNARVTAYGIYIAIILAFTGLILKPYFKN
jgi:hypothetical protein